MFKKNKISKLNRILQNFQKLKVIESQPAERMVYLENRTIDFWKNVVSKGEFIALFEDAQNQL